MYVLLEHKSSNKAIFINKPNHKHLTKGNLTKFAHNIGFRPLLNSLEFNFLPNFYIIAWISLTLLFSFLLNKLKLIKLFKLIK